MTQDQGQVLMESGHFLHWQHELNIGQYLHTELCIDPDTGRHYILVQAFGPEPPSPAPGPSPSTHPANSP